MSALRALAIALALTAASRTASAGPAPVACLGAGVGKVLERLVQAHALEGVAPGGYRLEHLDVKRDHIELGYDDDAGPAVTVVLTVAGPEGVDAAQHGPHFDHRLVEGHGQASAAARAAMLRAAMVVDVAMPAAELGSCGPPEGTREVRAPAVVGIGIGAVQVAIVLLALGLGVAGPRRGRGRPSPAPRGTRPSSPPHP